MLSWMDKPLRVTINTDASWCPNTKLGAYSIWITSDLGRIRTCGTFKTLCESSNDAEIKAIENAIFVLSKKIPKNIQCIVVINTDSMTAIDTLSIRYPMFQYKHVKAHTKVKDSRSFVNRWCDSMALETLRSARRGVFSRTRIEKLNWK